MIEELSKLKDLLDKVLIPVYPSLGGMGGGSGMETKLQEAWEAKFESRRKEYEEHRKIREQLSKCFEAVREVHLVTTGDGDDGSEWHVWGIFSSIKKAEEAKAKVLANQHSVNDVETWVLDQEIK